MNRGELLERLWQQRNHLEQELTQRIVHIENIDASIQAIENREINTPTFPPQNPFEHSMGAQIIGSHLKKTY